MQETTTEEPGTIIAQSRPKNTKIQSGATLTITVAIAPETNTTGESNG